MEEEFYLDPLPLTSQIDWKCELADVFYDLRGTYPEVAVLQGSEMEEFAESLWNTAFDEGLDMLGQELSAAGYALYSVDTQGDCVMFALLETGAAPPDTAWYRLGEVEMPPEMLSGMDEEEILAASAPLKSKLCRVKGLAWGHKNPPRHTKEVRLWDEAWDDAPDIRELLHGSLALGSACDDDGSYRQAIVDLAGWDRGASNPEDREHEIDFLRPDLDKMILLESVQRRADGICAARSFREQTNKVYIGMGLDIPAPAWTRLRSLGQYVDGAGDIAFRWLDEQLVLAACRPQTEETGAWDSFVLRYDTQGRLLDAVQLNRPEAPYISAKGAQVGLFRTRDGGLYLCAAGGVWAVTAKGIVHLDACAASLRVALPPQWGVTQIDDFCPVGDSEVCFVGYGPARLLSEKGWPIQQVTLCRLDMKTGALQTLCLDSLGVPSGCHITPRPMAAGWIVLEIQGYRERESQHLAILWHVQTGAFHSIPAGSFDHEFPLLLYVPSLERAFAWRGKTAWRCLPWDAFVQALQLDPELQLTLPPWELVSQG